MQVEIQSREFPVPPALANQAQHSLHQALDQRGESVQRIVLRLGGMNCGRERVDTYCLIQAHLADTRVATVIDIGPNAHDVIARATDRMGRTVSQYLKETA